MDHNGNFQAFMSPQLPLMYKSFAKNDTHVVKRATPLSWNDIQTICIYLDSANNVPLAIKPLILIGYTCFLRASNLLVTAGGPWPGPHTLLARNLVEVSQGLIVIIPSTKTKTRPYTVTIPRLPSPAFCPVSAWRYYSDRLSPGPSTPAFITSDRSPVHPKLVVALMRAALSSDPTRDLQSVSMHSLRRGAAQDASLAGVSNQQIMKRGGWASNTGLKPYLLE